MSRYARQQEVKLRRKNEGLAVRVFRVRIKDKHSIWLRKLASDVNTVWNYCNEIGLKVLNREGRFVKTEDLHKLTKGASKEGLLLHSQTIQAVNEEYVTRRKQFKKAKLSWRVSDPKRSNRSLGWIPFKKSAILYRNGQVHLAGVPLSLWDSYGLADYVLGSGNISEDARGRWYLNVTVEVKKKPRETAGISGQAIGFDLGLKDFLVDSEGGKIEAQRFYRDLEPALASAQRAGKENRTRAIHAKIANRRKDFLHKLSNEVVNKYQAIFVGDVSASSLAKTPMAKSVMDAGWSTFRTMLQYKGDDAGTWFAQIDESFSTQDCHVCGSRCGPKGLAGLSIRQWRCVACNTLHDRDTNSALNIRNRGLVWLEKQFSAADQDAMEVHGIPAVNKIGADSPRVSRPGMAVQ